MKIKMHEIIIFNKEDIIYAKERFLADIFLIKRLIDNVSDIARHIDNNKARKAYLITVFPSPT